jgi:hypothetical protein
VLLELAFAVIAAVIVRLGEPLLRVLWRRRATLRVRRRSTVYMLPPVVSSGVGGASVAPLSSGGGIPLLPEGVPLLPEGIPLT